MKILLVTHRYPPRTGGIETHVQKIASYLSDVGHKVSVFSADAGNDVASEQTINGTHIRRFQSVSLNNSFYFAPQMAFAVRRSDANVVHAHNYHAFPLFFAALGITNQKFVVTTHYHGGSSAEVRDRLLSLYRPIGKWALRRADRVVAVSNWEQKRLKTDFGVDSTVIPNGVEKEQFATADRKECEHPYLLHVGRLEKYKGVQYVIRAMSELPNYHFLVAGSGPYLDTLKRIAREEDVEDRVTFLGYVDQENLPKLYAGAEAYVTMSEFEAYGVTVAEALAAGIPCVVNDSTALRDWAKQDGVIGVSDRSKMSIKHAVEYIERNEVSTTETTSWFEITKKLLEEVYTENSGGG